MTATPPSTFEEAVKLPGSTMFACQDGLYQPILFHKSPSIGYCEYGQRVAVNQDIPNANDNKSWWYCHYNATTNEPETVTSSTIRMSCHRDTGSDISGAFFNALPPGSALTFNFVVYIEEFPAPTSAEITLATPPPRLDNVAIELTQAIALKMPAYAPYAANDHSLLWDVICGLGMVASRVIPNPLFAGALMGSLRLARTVSGNGPGRKPRR